MECQFDIFDIIDHWFTLPFSESVFFVNIGQAWESSYTPLERVYAMHQLSRVSQHIQALNWIYRPFFCVCMDTWKFEEEKKRTRRE